VLVAQVSFFGAELNLSLDFYSRGAERCRADFQLRNSSVEVVCHALPQINISFPVVQRPVRSSFWVLGLSFGLLGGGGLLALALVMFWRERSNDGKVS
jgi:hypothetical protein